MLRSAFVSSLLVASAFPLFAQPAAGPTIPGTWTATPIVESNLLGLGPSTAPRRVGDAWLLGDGALLYWAKIGEKDKGGWALFVAKEGAPRMLFTADEDFETPDGVKKRFRYFDFGSSAGTNDLLIGRATAYSRFVSGRTQGVYTVAASGLAHLLSNGDDVTLGGTAAKLKVVELQGMTPDGRAVLRVTTEKPDARTGWLVHDGRALTALWSIGDPIPGDAQSARVEGMIGVPHVFGDTTLVILATKPGEREVVLFRLTPGKAERLLTSGAPDPLQPEKKLPGPRDIRAASGDRFVVGVGYEHALVGRTQGPFAWQNDYKLRVFPNRWFGYTAGRWRSILAVAPSEEKLGFGPLLDSIAYVRRGSDSLLIATSFLTYGPSSPYGGAAEARRRVPALFMHDGARLLPIAPRNSTLNLRDLSLQIEKTNRILNPFGVRRLPGRNDVVVAEIPGLLGGSAVLHAGESALGAPAHFVVAGDKWSPTETDLVGWVDERTAIVAKTVLDVPVGYYRLVRQ